MTKIRLLNKTYRSAVSKRFKGLFCYRCNEQLDIHSSFYACGSNLSLRYLCKSCYDNLWLEVGNQPELVSYDFVLPSGRTIEIQEVI